MITRSFTAPFYGPSICFRGGDGKSILIKKGIRDTNWELLLSKEIAGNFGYCVFSAIFYYEKARQ